MKIFMSHSGKQKLFVKEIKRYLPHHINVWIDEKEIFVGDNIDFSIVKAIGTDCDFFIVVIDEYALRSEWVLKELNLAVKREEELKRIFLLPIVIDKFAWANISDARIRTKKYLYCPDFTDNTIEAISKELSSEIFAWLCKEFDNKNINLQDTSIKLIQDADKLSKAIAEEIKTIIHPYRKTNPLELGELIIHLKNKELIQSNEKEELIKIIERLVELNFLNGINYDGTHIYLSQERFSTKSSLYNNSKKSIAKKACSFINPGQTIALDGGSTTLELTKLICKNIKLRNLFNLKIVTNSIPNAFELLSTLGELGANDFNSACDVYLIGGHARPVSFTIASEDKYLGKILENDMQNIFDKIGEADMCFVGTNGITKDFNFANHNKYEVKAKSDMIKNSKRKFILTDASKFQVRDESVFASLDQGLEVITYFDEKYKDSIKQFQDFSSNTASTLIFA
jgi:DeoR/GlpR family transcriptional regulator of sugar metabolism